MRRNFERGTHVNWDDLDFHYIEIPITTVCNLNCFRCNHFAPIADPWYIDENIFIDYMIQLKRINDNWPHNIEEQLSVCLMGGEPTIHPNLLNLCRIAREYLPKAYIYICTNGILLKKFDQEFYDTLNTYKIGLQFSNYKNTSTYGDSEVLNLVNNIANQFEWEPHVPIQYVKNHEGFVNCKMNFVNPHSSYHTYSSCMKDNINLGIKDGKIYKCPQAGWIDILFKYFNISPELNYDNSVDTIDLYTSYYEDVVAFLRKPGKMCKYCQFFCNEPPTIWQQSKKELSEWVEDYNKGE